MTAATLLLVFTVSGSLCSCVVMQETDASGARATYASLGGKGAYRKGVGVIHNHEKSFRDGALAGGALAASYYGAASAQAAEVSSQVAQREGTRRAATSSAAQVQTASIAARGATTSQAIGAGAEIAPIQITAP